MRPEAGNPETHASLLGRLKAYDDRESWECFARTYGPTIYHFCRGCGVQDSSAADLVQEVLTQVAVSIRTFEYDRSRGRFRDWLGAVVRSKLARHWRATARAGETGRLDPANAAAAFVESEWDSAFHEQILRVALDTIRSGFSPINWQAFELTWLANQPAPDVAALLGIPVAQVYVAKSRVAKRLAEELTHLTEDAPRLA